jgi:homoserine trans-succinylase
MENIPLWSAENCRPSAFVCWGMESNLKQKIFYALEKLIQEVKQNFSTT